MALLTNELIQAAVKEMTEQSEAEIERATAIKWASRFMAALLINDVKRHNPESYRHEAIEHAAMASPGLLQQILEEINSPDKQLR